ncbi:hypothetical protein Z517_04650 [Fonsecaea pedrosoi CBS 271.37]|uniref:Uncharacterized protein n=1 Tax=Fonsecaea pedrosoi CBS 271.37 TaxID=1442368 RepID=A0A0D2HAP0_9EURO|nr:uncharacterized protein Z517_04650 [Fonsecaea pedrosoi CBS 271.37]KIW81624.1 hypothetical protein Z517_04650 [Fonsecaea pedrosoi CBS 271.37]
MLVRNSGTQPGAVIPLRMSSLSNGSTQSPSQCINTDFVMWPAPDGWYTPARVSLHEDEEPFPKFQDPTKSLIIERTLLLDTLRSRATSVLHHARDHERLRFEALLSRVAPSGHIKHDQDLSYIRASIPGILALGESFRAQRRLGNKGKLPASRGFQTNLQSSSGELQPKDILKEKMKERSRKGIRQALIYEKDFCMGLLDQRTNEGVHQRGRSIKRTHPGAFDRAKVTTALVMLRQTFPTRYEAIPLDQPKTSVISEDQKSSGKLNVEKVGQQEFSPGERAVSDANNAEGHSGRWKSTDSNESVKKKASSVFRGLVSKVSRGRFSNEKGKASGSSPPHAHTTSQHKVSGHVAELDSFPVALKINDTVAASSNSSEPTTAEADSSTERRKPQTKEVVSEAGIVRRRENRVSRRSGHPNASTVARTSSAQRSSAKPSSTGITGNNEARATTARLHRPALPPRMISVKARNRNTLHKRRRSQNFAASKD